MKKIIISLSSLCLLPCLAQANIHSAHGLYLGSNIVFAKYHPIEGAAFDDSILPFAGYVQPYLGLRFNDYFALQAGFSYLINDHHDGGKITTDILGNQEKLAPDHYRLYAAELTPKIIYPLNYGVSIHAKAGLAYVHQDVFNQVYESSLPSVDSQTNKILPIAGIGISYNITKHFATEVSFSHIQGIKPIGNIDMIAAGVNYTF